MDERSVQASVFKARCLALLDEVAEQRASIVVTKHGRAVARLVPIDQPTTDGSVTLLSDDDADFFTTGERWNVDG